MQYLPEILSISMIAIFMAMSPGADFIMVSRNSIFTSRRAGVFSAFGVAAAIWVHVAYSIAGLAFIISQSIVLFSILKYCGAAYLIYVGWKTFRAKATSAQLEGEAQGTLSSWRAFQIGFITNVLNPKTTLFFFSIFTQVVQVDSPLWLQLLYGFIISFAHAAWFCAVAIFLSQPVLLQKFEQKKKVIERLVGSLLMGFGLKIAMSPNP
ncbi:LysE family translocator [Algicola sagamiensis]|uniref:LysE family translocator n=1 Tax=Algicola sagamiensis TaxID=163869 RepID=UPI0003692FBF|nr:LysE family translocator [Algicola sagamiensis]